VPLESRSNTNVRARDKGLIEVRCAFCKGVGKDPFDLLSKYALCEVCGGTGKVMVAEPVHRCALCHGRGVFPGSRLTCTSCMGKGAVAVKEPAGPCPICLGAGVLAGHALPCSACGGKGLVTVAERMPAVYPEPETRERGERCKR
jgi:DnaJ-class molecular chaperone